MFSFSGLVFSLSATVLFSSVSAGSALDKLANLVFCSTGDVDDFNPKVFIEDDDVTAERR